MTDYIEIKHYPFGRWSLMRELIPFYLRTDCDYCGYNPGKFIYYSQSDSISGRMNRIKGCFCSKNCMSTYHDFWDK